MLNEYIICVSLKLRSYVSALNNHIIYFFIDNEMISDTVLLFPVIIIRNII